MTSPQESVAAWANSPPAVYVAQAKFGLGVFAQRIIVPDEIIGEVTGEIITEKDYGSEYCIDLDTHRVLEPAEPFRFVNHSCDPNCEIFSWDEVDGDITPDRIWLTALRTIRPDEELSIDYAWEAEAAIPCGCGSDNCRGWIVDVAELDQVLREKKGGRRPLKPTAASQKESRRAESRRLATVGTAGSSRRSSPDRSGRKRRPRD